MLFAAPIAVSQLSIYAERLTSLLVLYLPRLLSALLLLVIGWWIIGWASRLVSAATSRLDVSLSSFLSSMFSIALKVLLLISAAGMAGFETTSFVAILGAAGLAVGLALQGTLANFAGGVLILIFKPFTVGDVIESQGKSGTVQAIQIFNTLLLTPQGDTVILPNALHIPRQGDAAGIPGRHRDSAQRRHFQRCHRQQSAPAAGPGGDST